MEYTIQHREDHNIIIATAKGQFDSKMDNSMVREIMETVDV